MLDPLPFGERQRFLLPIHHALKMSSVFTVPYHDKTFWSLYKLQKTFNLINEIYVLFVVILDNIIFDH